jgi:ubiquitin-small subunit ribosomal protein S27Ae
MAEKKEAKGKKQKKDKKPLEVWKRYTTAGGKAVSKNKNCPKCGADSALANHKNRLYCGKCHYVEMRK